jgi:serine/threonine-protein phosphatase 2A regulatory subunit B
LSTTIFSTADIISAVEFDKSGEHLATGDRGGRVVLFERLRPTKSALEAMRAETERAADRFDAPMKRPPGSTAFNANRWSIAT